MIESPLIQAALYVGGIYLFLNAYAYLIADRIIFQPRKPEFDEPLPEIKIRTADGGEISAVYLEHPEAKLTLLFSHGNAEDLSRVFPFVSHFHDLGWSVLMYDYRGYGNSAGKASTNHAKLDVLAAYDWLVNERGADPKTIIAHGRSLGGGVAAWLAANRAVGGLIIESSFASAFRVKTRWPLLPWDRFNTLKAMRAVSCPVFILHGKEDSVIPFWHAEKILAAAPEPKHRLWIEGAEHNDYAYVAGDAYWAAIQSFLDGASEYQSASVE